MISAQTLDRPKLVTPTEVNLVQSESDRVAFMYYKPSVDCDMQTSVHKAVEQHEYDEPKHYWKKEVQLSDEYAGYRENSLDKLTKL